MRPRILTVLTVALTLAFPAAALARTTKVVPFKTIAGVPLGLTPKQVVKRLGKPNHTVRVSGKVAEYDYHRLDLSVQFDTLHHPIISNGVFATVGPFTRKIGFHTVHGIRIGSTIKQVKRAFGSKLRCTHGGFATCNLYNGHPGAIGTVDFGMTFANGKVTEFSNQTSFKDF